MIDDKSTALFDLLNDLAEEDEETLKSCCSREMADDVKKLAAQLNDRKKLPAELSKRAFAALVYELRDIKRTWSRKLSDALILALGKEVAGDITGATIVLDKFMKECPAPFYRNIAMIQINNYKKS